MNEDLRAKDINSRPDALAEAIEMATRLDEVYVCMREVAKGRKSLAISPLRFNKTIAIKKEYKNHILDRE